MRKDAELLKFHLRRSNVSNGPHFHVPTIRASRAPAAGCGAFILMSFRSSGTC